MKKPLGSGSLVSRGAQSLQLRRIYDIVYNSYWLIKYVEIAACAGMINTSMLFRSNKAKNELCFDPTLTALTLLTPSFKQNNMGSDKTFTELEKRQYNFYYFGTVSSGASLYSFKQLSSDSP